MEYDRESQSSLWVDFAIEALKVLFFICEFVTFPIYYAIQRPWEKIRLSAREKAKIISTDENSMTIRSLSKPQAHHITICSRNIDTMEKILQHSAREYSDRNCLGTRKVLAETEEVQPDGKVFKKCEMGDYIWKSYADVNAEVDDLGYGLAAIGQKRMSNIAIFAETRCEWLISAQACFRHNFPVVTIYATLGESALIHAINQTKVSVVITSHELLPKLRNVLKRTPCVRTVVYMEDQLARTDESGFEDNIKLYSYKEVMERGRNAENKTEPVPPTGTDTAIIMYTSGSTGDPKGVILTHSNMVGTIKGFSDYVISQPNDVYIAYLPLAHVYELLSEYLCLVSGVSIGYSGPLTLTDQASKIMRGQKGDASVLKPTIFTIVPLILDRVYKGVTAKVAQKSLFKRKLFKFTVSHKQKWMSKGFTTPLLDRFIFSEIRNALGGRVRVIISGGAPLSPQTHEFARTCLCYTVLQGYGLTESCAAALAMDFDDITVGRAGTPLTICDVKIVNCDEGKITDKPYPRGEIHIGGENVAGGYYELPEKTRDEFYEDAGRRWFKTGDIGEYHSDGAVKIIDRKKDLVKLQGGEFVSLGKIEALLRTCAVVENICIYADSFKNCVVALVVPNIAELRRIAQNRGLADSDSIEMLCEDQRVNQDVLAMLMSHAKINKFERLEIPKAVKLCADEWTPDNDLVTAALKLKRREIKARYQLDIERMYASLE